VRKVSESIAGIRRGEVALIANDGHHQPLMVVVELGPSTSLDGRLAWGMNRLAKILDADIAAYT
jgi:hypothetical protein